jgi:hypothetical protein
MNSRWLKITLRFTAAILLMFAAVRFAIDCLSSFHTETHASPNGGISIDHTLAINHVTIIMAIVGVLLFAFTFVVPRKRV